MTFSYIGLADDSTDLLEDIDSYLAAHRNHVPQLLRLALYEMRDHLNNVIDSAASLAQRGADHRAGW
jgi:hypothetical protein